MCKLKFNTCNTHVCSPVQYIYVDSIRAYFVIRATVLWIVSIVKGTVHVSKCSSPVSLHMHPFYRVYPTLFRLDLTISDAHQFKTEGCNGFVETNPPTKAFFPICLKVAHVRKVKSSPNRVSTECSTQYHHHLCQVQT
jgi:hypothetical protein